MVPILIPLFVSAFRRADELAMAMECRCYRGGEGRTRLKQLHLTGKDWVVLSSAWCCLQQFGQQIFFFTSCKIAILLCIKSK